MGQFKEKKIEETDRVLQDIQGTQRSYQEADDSLDFYSFYLPHFDEEVGGLLPHERPLIPAAQIFNLFRTGSIQ